MPNFLTTSNDKSHEVNNSEFDLNEKIKVLREKGLLNVEDEEVILKFISKLLSINTDPHFNILEELKDIGTRLFSEKNLIERVYKMSNEQPLLKVFIPIISQLYKEKEYVA